MKQRITPELSDSIFEGIDIPDDATVRRQTAVAKRELSGWLEKKNSKIEQQRQTLIETQHRKLQQDPDYFNKIQKKKKKTELQKSKLDPNYKKTIIENKRKVSRTFWENADTDYVKEYGVNVSKSKNPISPELAFEIYYKCLEPREEVRTLKYYKQLAKDYNVPESSILSVIRGDHYAFGGERVKDPSGKHRNIRINHTEINPTEDLKNWRLKVNGKFKFTDPNGKVYMFDSFEEAGNWMNSTSNTKGDAYLKCYKKFMNIAPNTPTKMLLGFWKGWVLENVK